MTNDAVTIKDDGSVGRIILNRPAINPEVAQGLLNASIHYDEKADIRALVLSSSCKFFCAGGDLEHFAAQGDGISAALKDLTTHLHAAISRLYRMQKPLVVAVNGVAAGAGMSLAIMGDFVVAAKSAVFTMAYTGIGFSPDGSSSYFLPRLIGERRAKELMITNRTLSAAEALEWGLVNQVVDDAEVMHAANKLASDLARGPTRAFGGVKTLLNSSWSESLETQMTFEADLIAANAASEDGKEGLAAFRAKRKPEFAGR